MARGQRTRRFDSVLEMTGGDPGQVQPNVDASAIGLTYQADDWTYSLPPRTRGRLWLSLVPSIAAAQFSGFELMPAVGCWIREIEFLGAGNCTMHAWMGGVLSAMAANDNLLTIAAPFAAPDSSDVQQFGGIAFQPYLGQVTFPGQAGIPFPTLFSFAQVGRFGAAQNGLFCFGGGATVFTDFWLAPGSILQVAAVLANTGIAVRIQLDFPADAWV